MAGSLLETSLHPVNDLAQLPSAYVAVIRLHTNERQTRVISQKQLASVYLLRSCFCISSISAYRALAAVAIPK